MSAIDVLRETLKPELFVGRDPDAVAEDLVAKFDAATVRQLYADIVVANEEGRYTKFENLFPDATNVVNNFVYWARDLYPKHLEHFRMGKVYRERCFMAANRIGKTVAGSYEVSAHLTGRYPHWWEGRTFRRSNRWWVAGDTNETTRDILQLELLGEVGFRGNRKTVDGSGIIPRDCIGDVTWKQGVQNLIDTVEIKHRSGAWSLLALKSYDQGRRAFQGTAKEGIMLDEEPPMDVYNECLVRTATTRGIILITFTPLSGISEVVQSFLPQGYVPGEA